MPVYEYKALNGKGRQIKGILDAANLNTAKRRLRALKLFPVSVAEMETPSDTQQKKTSFLFHPRLTVYETAVMTRQLATLISAGFPLIKALNTLLVQVKKPSLKKIISQVKDSIEEGSSFADALGRYPHIFSRIYVNMVRAGEASGTLGVVLESLADISENQSRMNKKIQSAMAYPIIMTVICIGVLIFLLTVIVPNITSIFKEMNQALPFTTQFLIDVSQALQQWWWLILSGVLLTGGSYILLMKRPYFQMARDRAILALPGLGELIKKICVARFTRTLGALLRNGVSLLESLEIVRKIVGNTVIEHGIRKAGIQVEQGQELGDALSAMPCFPHFCVEMIQLGEQSGKLETMLEKTAKAYDEEVNTTLMGFTALLEPIIILIMAVVVGFIVLSICLPIFEMNQLIK